MVFIAAGILRLVQSQVGEPDQIGEIIGVDTEYSDTDTGRNFQFMMFMEKKSLELKKLISKGESVPSVLIFQN